MLVVGGMMSDTETQAIERATAEGFVAHYNAREGTDYRVVTVAGPGESPDVKCLSSNGDELWLEVTITEDNLHDAQALLGRSEHKDLNALRDLMDKVKTGIAKMPINRLDGNVANPDQASSAEVREAIRNQRCSCRERGRCFMGLGTCTSGAARYVS